jgi:integrase
LAIDGLPSALVILNAHLDHARRVLLKRTGDDRSPTATSRKALTPGELARIHYNSQLALDEALRNSDAAWAQIGIDDGYVESLRAAVAGRLTDPETEALLGNFIDRYRLRGQVAASPGEFEWRKIARTIAGAELEVLARMSERDEGEFIPWERHPEHLREPSAAPEPAEAFVEPVSLLGLLEGYLTGLEAGGRGRSARKLWPPVFKDLVSFLRQFRGLSANSRDADDARKLTKAEVIAWRDEKLKTLAPRTVKDVWIASLKAVLNAAVQDDKLPINPVSGVKVRVTTPVRNREKGYTTAEATAILNLCRHYGPEDRSNPSNRESAHVTAAKRWGPWLCALTGARIGEILQLRKADVRKEGDAFVLRISPEAGTVKTRAFRDIPCHRQLIELGFIDFVAGSADGPLFHSSSVNGATTLPAEAVATRVAKWLQSSGLVPKDVSPNHGWRHRFKTVGREAGVDARILDAIQGHASRTAGDAYGDVTLGAKARALALFPDYAIEDGGVS